LDIPAQRGRSPELEALRRLPETQKTTELITDTHIDIQNALLTFGEVEGMGRHLHEAEILARRLGDQRRLGRIATFMAIQGCTERFGAPAIQSALSEASLAQVLSELGQFDEAVAHAEVAVRIAEGADHPFSCKGI